MEGGKEGGKEGGRGKKGRAREVGECEEKETCWSVSQGQKGSVARDKECTHNRVGEVMERFVAQGPHLVEYHPIAPHITGRGVLVVVQGLRGGGREGKGREEGGERREEGWGKGREEGGGREGGGRGEREGRERGQHKRVRESERENWELGEMST